MQVTLQLLVAVCCQAVLELDHLLASYALLSFGQMQVCCQACTYYQTGGAMTGTQTGSRRILSYLCKNLPVSRSDTLCSMTQECKGSKRPCKARMTGQVAPSSALQFLLRDGKQTNADRA